MGLEQVKNEILNEAETRANKIIEEAEEQRDELLSEAEEKADRIVSDAEQDAENEAQALRQKRLSAARMQAKRKRLEAREDLLEQVYDQFRERVQDLDEDREEELIENALESLSDDIEIGTVYASAAHEDLAEQYGDFEEKDITGIIVESADGSQRFNMQFDDVADHVIDENQQAVSKVLFE